MSKEESRGITGVLIVAFVVRFAWALMLPRTPEAISRLPDQQEYLSLGRNLLNQGSLSFVDRRFGQTIWAYRMPGYPIVIAACGGSVLAVRILQCLIDTSTVLAVYLIGGCLLRRTGNDPENKEFSCSNYWGLIAAILIAANPFYIYFSGLLLSETVFSSLLIWALWLLIRRQLLLGSVFLVLACYFRPAAMLMAPLIAAVAMMNSPHGTAYQLLPALRRGLTACIFVMLLMLIAFIPWAFRNHLRLASWVWATTNGGITLYDGFRPGATGASDQRFLAAMPELRSMNEVERSRSLAHAAKDWAKAHAANLPLLSVRKVLRTWSPIPLSDEFGRPIYRVVSSAYAVPFDVFCLVGLFSRRLKAGTKLLLIAPAVLITMTAVMSVGSIRYRIPAEAPLTVLAAVGAVDLGNRLISRRAHSGRLL